jgi:ABC-type nitrate/sulfonate/bicarbonate transport system permease component
VFAGLKVTLPRAISAAVVGEFIAADRGPRRPPGFTSAVHG